MIKKRKRKKRLVIIVSVFLLCLAAAVTHFIKNVNPVIVTVSEEQVKALTATAVNSAALEVMSANVSYDDMIRIDKDNAGKITLISANSAVLNTVARSITLKAQNNISVIGQYGIGIPVGSLSGFTFLAGRGPNVKLRVLPVGSVETRFSSEFTSAGINQTNHKIFLRVLSGVSVVIPGFNSTIKNTTEIIVAESVIIGEVPEVYLQSGSLDEMLNLIP